MKKIVFLILIPLFIIQSAHAQGITPKEWGLNDIHLQVDRLGEINFYVTEKGIDQEKPLLFLFSGTSGLPTMLIVKSGDKSLQLGTVPPDQINSF